MNYALTRTFPISVDINEHGDLCNDVIVTCNVGSIQHFYIEQHEEGGKIQI